MDIFGISLFADLAARDLGLLAAIYFFSFALKGMFGLGAMPPLVIFGSWVLGPHHAVVLAVVSNIFSQIQFTPEALRSGDWRLVRPLVLAYLPATILGVWIFGSLESAWLTVVVGVMLVIVILVQGSALLRRYDSAIRERAPVLGPVMAAISGIVGGVVGAGGVILVSTYIKMMCSDARILRATILLIATFFIVWRTVVYAANGFVPLSVLVECVILLPVVFIGGHVGSRLFGLFPKDRFFVAFKVFLILASLNLVYKGLRDLI
jgi:uncharacterized protein